MQALLAAPRDTLAAERGQAAAEALVRDAINLDRGVRLRHRVDVLDTLDRPTGEWIPVESGQVTWSYRPPGGLTSSNVGDAAEVRRRADLTLAGQVSVPLIARRYRPRTDFLASDGTWVTFWHGVFVATLPGVDDDGTVVRRRLRLADKTWRYANRYLTQPISHAPGTNPVEVVRSSLGAVFTETSVAISPSTVVLEEGRTFEAGMSYLAYYGALLEIAGFDYLTADEAGRPRSVLLADVAQRGSETTYGPGAGKIVPAGALEPLLPSLPNVVRFVARQGPSLQEEGNGIVIVRNQSTGPGSIDERGEEVEHRVEVEAENQEQLEAIAAAESQRWFAGGGNRFTGRVGLNPLHGDRDVVTLDKPRLGLNATCLVTEWGFPLEPVGAESSVTMPIVCEQRVG